MLGLISFSACCCAFSLETLGFGAAELECAGELEEPLIYVSPASQRGGTTSHRGGGLTRGGAMLLGGTVWTIWFQRGPVYPPLVRGVLRCCV